MSKSIPVPYELQIKVADRMNECYDMVKAELVKFGYDANKITIPTVDYKKRGRAAGTAYPGRNNITLNSILLVENADDFIDRTVGHEVAHIFSWQLFGAAGKGHGRLWKIVMGWIGQSATRCHTFNTSNSRQKRTVKRHVYGCGCREFKLTTGKHNKVLRNQMQPYCTSCNENLKYIGTEIRR